jgi:carnosine N-methyltransferase
LRRQSFYALPRAHWELLAKPPFSYLDTLEAVDDAIDKNAEVSQAILQSGLASFGISLPGRDQPAGKRSNWLTSATTNDLEKARSTLRQLFRDWSEEGRHEREACYEPVLKAIRNEALVKVDQNLQILVPGAGLGRLVFDLCCAGFDAEGNEISYHQLLASAYILNSCPTARMHTLYPWVHSFSNHKDRVSHLRSVQIPDINPALVLGGVENPGRMSMSASDFLLLYESEEQKHRFDVVATVFFLDTAPNIIRYLEAIRNCLKPGGILVNAGPLLWHFENNAPGSHGTEESTSSETMGLSAYHFILCY